MDTGNTVSCCNISRFCPGSSPWIRGTLNLASVTSNFYRFIPVDTGNTGERCQNPCNRPVHPRGYGEHQSIQEKCVCFGGSSPWIRGTLSKNPQLAASARFIPVDTGNTCWMLGGRLTAAVHPRGYGEHRLTS